MAKKGKRLRTAYEGIDRTKDYTLDEAIGILKAAAKTKFDETVEISMNLGIDPRHSDQNVRGAVTLPNGTGRTLRVAVFAKGDKAEEATAAGADVVGAEDLAEKVQEGQIDFERVIATPDMMPVVGRLGKVLGPKGLMPNPKVGTVTQDVAEAVKAAKGGQVQFRAEKAGIIHAGIGKVSFSRGGAGGQRPRLRQGHQPGQAERRERQLHQEGFADVDDGPWSARSTSRSWLEAPSRVYEIRAGAVAPVRWEAARLPPCPRLQAPKGYLHGGTPKAQRFVRLQ